jgi:FtsZ-interacting cell division protein YlmF
MKERWRGLLGFLGLVADDHGDFGPNYGREIRESEVDDSWSVGERRPSPQSRPVPRTAQPVQPPRPAQQSRTIPSVTVIGAPSGAPRIMEPMNSVRRGAPSNFNPSTDLVVLAPNSINDANQIVLTLRENRAIVLSTAGISKQAQQRLLDFTSGSVYALRASIKKLSDVRWLLIPQGLVIDEEFIERIKYANLSDGQF